MKRSKFNLSHRHHTTMEMGKLIPFYIQDCLPGDIFRISNQAIFRAQPMVAPVISQINWVTQYYFVPYRILWDNWTEFITGGDDGLSNPSYPVVKSPENGWEANTLSDYFGFPIKQGGIEVSAMPFRAMCKIWNDHYKIEDIEADIEFSTSDGVDTTTPLDLLPVHWKRDYFTKAKPFTQRGAQVSVPVIPSSQNTSGYAIYKPTYTTGTPTNIKPTTTELGLIILEPNTLQKGQDSLKTSVRSIDISNNIALGITEGYIRIIITEGGINGNFGDSTTCPVNTNFEFYVPITKIEFKDPLNYSNAPYLKGNIDLNISPITSCMRRNNNTITYVKEVSQIKNLNINDLEFTINQNYQNAGAINIRDLRVASAYQRFNERSLKYGAEYEDYCRMEFGVRPRDSRLNKSEYLGGNKSPLQISEVIQTSPGAQGQTPLGSMAGMGIGQARQRRIKYFCPEHGIIIGLASIRPETIYTQGIDRAWLKRSRFDYFTYEFSNIGAQEIFQQELYATKSNKDKVFGYALNGNYNEYRHQESRLSGNFRTDLSFWHLGRQFAEAPVLNASFMRMNPRKDIFAITDSSLPAFLVMLQNNIVAYRPIPKRSKNILK